MGEFGVNDYHFSFPTKSLQEITAFVPEVIRTISMAIEVPTYLVNPNFTFETGVEAV